ncbi:hypothetical protein ACLVWQ_09045 [Streptomyces sp. CWNU-52B]|uniref:hypothetical protein n=1 Tax=unclassified Streptomyces TaxID=2593676 RepID=UPI0039BFA0FE
MLVASDAFYTSGTFWAAAAVIVAIAVGVGAVWATLRAANPKRSVHISMVETRLLRGRARLGPTLEITRGGTVLRDPRLVSIYLRNPSRRDIASSSFDQGLPLKVGLGTSILDLLGTEALPATAQAPAATISGSELHISPGRIGRQSQITYSVLIDGDASFSCQHSLIDVDVVEAEPYDSGRPTFVTYATGALSVVTVAMAVSSFFRN